MAFFGSLGLGIAVQPYGPILDLFGPISPKEVGRLWYLKFAQLWLGHFFFSFWHWVKISGSTSEGLVFKAWGYTLGVPQKEMGVHLAPKSISSLVSKHILILMILVNFDHLDKNCCHFHKSQRNQKPFQVVLRHTIGN